MNLAPRLSVAVLRRFEVAKVSEVKLDKCWEKKYLRENRADLVRAVAS